MLKDRELARIRDALTSYRNLTTILGYITSQGGDALTNLNVAAMQQDVRTKLDDMSPLTIFEQANKNCNDADFFIALTNEVRNAGARTQKFLGKLGRIEDTALGKQLELLKTDYCENAKLIAEIENRLKIKKDILLREKVKDVKIF
jgi:hypothetical protein